MKPALGILALLLLALGVWAFAPSLAGSQPHSLTELRGQAFGTTWNLKLADPAPAGLEARITELLLRMDAKLSNWRSDSDVSRFNQSAGEDWFEVDPMLAELVASASSISEETRGAMDITLEPVLQLWGLATQLGTQSDPNQTQPTREALDEARKHVGHHLVQARLSPPALRRLDPRTRMHLAAVGEGFALEKLDELLASQGLRNYLLELGGEMIARGTAADAKPWRVGIEIAGQGVLPVSLTQLAMSTSGSHQQGIRVSGQWRPHLLDPRTAAPVEHALVSCTVVHASALRADGLATGLMVLGPDEGWQLALKKDWAVLMVVREGEALAVRMTPAMAKLCERTR